MRVELDVRPIGGFGDGGCDEALGCIGCWVREGSWRINDFGLQIIIITLFKKRMNLYTVPVPSLANFKIVPRA